MTQTETAPQPVQQSSDPTKVVPTRRISFEESLADLPKHFAKDGDIVTSHVIASLSAVFPDGEDFFVSSVRKYRDRIEDPALKRQVSGFIGQEAVHGREHRAFNARLSEHGYITRQVEKITEKGLTFRDKWAPNSANLAMTAALEHFTATLAEAILTDSEVREMMGDQAVINLFAWHALEESEHKAVAFDVYKVIGGSERLRVWTMKGIRIGFIITMMLQVFISLLFDSTARRHPIRTWRSFRRFFRSPMWSKEMWRELKAYDAPDFHPDDRNTDDLVETWRTELFGDAGSLNDLLVTRKAA